MDIGYKSFYLGEKKKRKWEPNKDFFKCPNGPKTKKSCQIQLKIDTRNFFIQLTLFLNHMHKNIFQGSQSETSKATDRLSLKRASSIFVW